MKRKKSAYFYFFRGQIVVECVEWSLTDVIAF